MDFSASDKRRIFMSYRSVFSSAKGQLRHKKKKIRKVVLANGGISQDLVKEFGLEKVVDILRYLLGKGVFRSELEAKLEFPELFESESSRTIRRAASEDEAARSESEALDAIDADAHHIEGAGEVLPLDDRQLQGRATSSREHENSMSTSLYERFKHGLIHQRYATGCGLAIPIVRAIQNATSRSYHGPAHARRMLLRLLQNVDIGCPPGTKMGLR